MKKYVIITGMSGAGKTTAIKIFEDIGYFYVANLPTGLLPNFINFCENEYSKIDKVAIGIEVNEDTVFDELFLYLDDFKTQNKKFEILFLDCSDEIILRRYNEMRKNHNFQIGERLIDNILKEREVLSNIKNKADYKINTSYILPKQLKQNITDIFLEDKGFKNIVVTILSFGFKYGIPIDADIVFDVRFLPNPFYIDELKYLTGNDVPVQNYVMAYEESNIFLAKIKDMLSFLIPNYIKDGKTKLVLAIGCTGGKHRSVTLCNEIFSEINKLGYSTIICNRDIDKDINK